MRQKDCIASVDNLFNQRRTDAKLRQADRYSEIEKKIPEIIKIEQQMRAVSAKFFNKALNKDISKDEFQKIKSLSLDLQEKRAELLYEKGYPIDYLEIKYNCSKCNDTGYIGSQMCGCFKKALSEEYLKCSNLHKLYNCQSFDKYDLTFFKGPAQKKAELLLNYCIKYSHDFNSNSDNLMLTGKPGCGKTFIATCIGSEIINNGHFVYYTTAQDMIDSYDVVKFNKDGASDIDLDVYTNCELLIIDDLGTEFQTSFSETALYNVINTRINLSLPIIVSTNIAPNEMTGIYQDRLVSRFSYSFTKIPFPDCDIRHELEARRHNVNKNK